MAVAASMRNARSPRGGRQASRTGANGRMPAAVASRITETSANAAHTPSAMGRRRSVAATNAATPAAALAGQRIRRAAHA